MFRDRARWVPASVSAPPIVAPAPVRTTAAPHAVRERAFGSLKYERLYREQIDDALDLVREAEGYRAEFNTVRPHEALSWNRPAEVHSGRADPTSRSHNPLPLSQGTHRSSPSVHQNGNGPGFCGADFNRNLGRYSVFRICG